MDSKVNSLDTSMLARLFLKDRPEVAKKIDKFLEGSGRQFYIEDQAITELVYLLGSKARDRFSHLKIGNVVDYLIHSPLFITNTARMEKVLRIYRAHPKLSFNDCYLAVMAEERGATPLWTLDHKLALQTTAASEFPTDLV